MDRALPVLSSLARLCVEDSQCPGHHFCLQQTGIEKGICTQIPLGENLGLDLLVGGLAFVIAGISLAAGVGGGGLYVPLLMGVLSFDTHDATALSPFMLCGGAIAAFAYNFNQTNPRNPDEPLIDFQLACLIAAGLVSGAQLGTIAHDIAPPALLVIVLVAVLADAAQKGVNSAKKISANEQKTTVTGGTVPSPPIEVDRTSGIELTVLDQGGSENLRTSITADGPLSIIGTAALDTDGSESSRRVRVARFRLVYVWVVVLVMVLCKGLLVKICDPSWWLLNSATVLLLGLSDVYFARQLSKQVPLDESSLDFRQLSYGLALKSFLAGVLAAVCGIGGGMVMGPILVQMKVPPPVSAATTATTLLVLSSSTGLVYMCRAEAPLDYSIYLSFVTMCGAYTGKVLVGNWVQRTGKESIIVFCLAGITIASLLAMGFLGLFKLFNPEAWHFHALCSKEFDTTDESSFDH